MSSWDKICRICSSPAEYEVFAKIPTYLHAAPKEFLNWQKPINVLIEETTGLMVSPEDGLPRKICALCISYLKHASNFREQAINNALALLAANVLMKRESDYVIGKRHEDKESVLVTADELNYAEGRQIDTNLLMNNCQQQERDKVNKQLLKKNVDYRIPSPQVVHQHIRYLNSFANDSNVTRVTKHKSSYSDAVAFERNSGSAEDAQTGTSSEDNDRKMETKRSFFTYQETNFEEDDIMDGLTANQSISINIPETCKERKCRACSRRFMFEESFQEHIDTCIEYRFMCLIEEVNILLNIRRNRCVSPHEYIRRMIFSLRKTCDWLKINCCDVLLPDLTPDSDASNKPHVESEDKSSATSSNDRKRATKIKLEQFLSNFQKAELSGIFLGERNQQVFEVEQRENLIPGFNLLQSGNNFRSISNTPTPITSKNNILYEIERSQSRCSLTSSQHSVIICNFMEQPNILDSTEKPLEITAKCEVTKNQSERERQTFLQKLQNANNLKTNTTKDVSKIIPMPATPIIAVRKDLLPTQALKKDQQNLCASFMLPRTPQTPPFGFSAHCNPCALNFETLTDLELHNAMNHNTSSAQMEREISVGGAAAAAAREKEHQRLIALFEGDSDN